MKDVETRKIEYPDRIGDGEWKKTDEGKSQEDGVGYVLYNGNFLDTRNDSILMYLLDRRDRLNPNLDMVLELGDLILNIGSGELYELPFSKGMNFDLPESYGILASKICSALGFQHYEWEYTGGHE